MNEAVDLTSGGHQCSGDRSQRKADPALLCVAHFPTNTGYAWDFIESLYAGVARRLEPYDVTTWVSYPVVDAPPKTLQGSPAARSGAPRGTSMIAGSVRRLIRFIRSRNVRALYMADQPAWHPVYPLLRGAGVRWIVVHDHTSGERTPRDRHPRADQAALPLIPGTLADRVIVVSDFVARRKIEVDLVPPDRLIRIWNAVTIPDDPSEGLDEFRTRTDCHPSGR